MIVALVCVDSMIVTNPRCRLTMVNLTQSYNKTATIDRVWTVVLQ